MHVTEMLLRRHLGGDASLEVLFVDNTEVELRAPRGEGLAAVGPTVIDPLPLELATETYVSLLYGVDVTRPLGLQEAGDDILVLFIRDGANPPERNDFDPLAHLEDRE